jgi:hypothetical protein
MRSENPANQTRSFLREEYLWPGASFELDDVQRLHSGRRIFVYGTGETLVQVVSPGFQEQRYEFRLERSEVRRLFQLCLENDLATIKPTERSGLPDEARPRLKLVSADNMVREVSKWAGVQDARFDAIYTGLLQLEERTRSLEPTLIGRFESYYRPKREWGSKLAVFLCKKFDDMKYLDLREVARDIARFLIEVIIILVKLWPHWLFIAFLFLIAYFWIIIDPAHTYGFGGAILHGLFWFQNAVLALFTEREYWAPLNTGWGYQIGFVIGVAVIPFIVKTSLEIIVEVLRGN